MSTLTSSHAQHLKHSKTFQWSELKPLPDKFGFAGTFSGVSGEALIVVGGANFPDGGAPWTGSKKVWSDKIFVLDKFNGDWKLAGKLPEPLGYGVSVTYKDELICIGGSNEMGHSAKVYAIAYQDGKLRIRTLNNLPHELANSSGALIGDVVYVAGGLKKADSQEALGVFWSLDLSRENQMWKEIETWPGSPRMLAVAGSDSKSFFLFSGTNLVKSAAGEVQREYLKDAFSYQPTKGWTKLTDLPHSVVAAPGPAYCSNHKLYVFGGDDGSLAKDAANLKAKHPGFSDQILCFDPAMNKWTTSGTILKNVKSDAEANPNGSIWPAVTAGMVEWKGHLIFPSGEVRPAVRTPRVITAKPIK